MAFLLKLFVSGTLLTATAWPQTEGEWRIDTIAGSGMPGASGDGSRAVEAQLDFPVAVAVDNAGNVYIAEHYSHRIRRVDPVGIIDTVAGTGEPSYGGDGGPAVKARLFFPSAVVADHVGNLYIADTGNHRIRRVDASGTITTIAGTGESGFDWEGPAIEARLSKPKGVAVDGSGNLYIAGSYSFGIRQVDATGTMSKVAGSGISHDGPDYENCRPRDRGIAVDHAGNLYISSNYNYVRRVDATETVTVIAGTREPGCGREGSPVIKGHLNYPAGVAADNAGNVYIADSGQPPDSPSGSLGNHHHHRRDWEAWLRWGWRSGVQSAAGLSCCRGSGQLGQTLHRRPRQLPDPAPDATARSELCAFRQWGFHHL